MKCYVCEKEPRVGGTNFRVREAVGTCHHCGIAVCLEHSHKATEPGSPLLCPTCDELLRQTAIQEPSKLAIERHN